MRCFQKVNSSVSRLFKKACRLPKMRREGLKYLAPNFIYFPRLTSDSVIIDAGCSYEADFSMHMINEYQLKVYAVDPTLKHRKALRILEEKHKGRFIHLPFAITAEDGALTFYESKVNESGSILADHINVRMDETTSYEVKAISLKSLLNYIGVKQIDILKLDIEGVEYDLVSRISREELLPFKQIFIEFHHHAVTKFSEVDTKRIVERVCGFGFKSFSVDDHNYLFSQVN